MIGQGATKDAIAGPQRPRKGPSEIENRIFALLKSIPLKPGITEEHCRSYANYLNGVAVFAHMNHQRPDSQRVGARRTQAELEKLSDLAEKIAKVMNSTHLETNELIEAALPKGKSLSQYKREMNEVFRVLYQADVEAGEFSAKGEKPSDFFAAEVTRGAAEVFIALTGRKATANVKSVPAGYSGTKAVSYGPFLDFLRAAFDILGVDASPDYHARRLRRNRT
jgi:hypothetical protein